LNFDGAQRNRYDHSRRRQRQAYTWKDYGKTFGSIREAMWQEYSDRIARGVDPRTGNSPFQGVAVRYEVDGETFYTELVVQ